MAFRRVNVKPNLQAPRASTPVVRPPEIALEVEEQKPIQLTTQVEQIDLPLVPSVVIEETPAVVDEPNETSTPPPHPPTHASSPPPSPAPSPAAPARPLFRRKIAPNVSVKTAIHHRRPSASCSGTESETESNRQKHTSSSSISIGRVTHPPIKSSMPYEQQSISISELPIEGEITPAAKFEANLVEASEPSSLLPDVTSLPSRAGGKISREYLTQHINYRAHRLAAKIEPDMSIRRRRAATMEKIDESGNGKGAPVDTSKLKIAYFVHYNPSDNPMEAKNKTAPAQPTGGPVRKQSIASNDDQYSTFAPQLKIDENGTVNIDPASLEIRNTTFDQTPRHTVVVDSQFNDDNLTHKSYRNIGRRKRWNTRDTLRFYQALRMCGTDFTQIARVFLNRDRNDIKRKFKTEDKANRTLIDSALRQRIPFDLTCFYSPSEDSAENENGSDTENVTQKKTKKRRLTKRKPKQTPSADPLEINRRRERRLQAKKNSLRGKKSAEFVDDDDDDESSIDVADTIEITTTDIGSKREQTIPSIEDETSVNIPENNISNMAEFEHILGKIDGSHLLFVHNTDESTGLDRIDVHVVMPNTQEDSNGEQQNGFIV